MEPYIIANCTDVGQARQVNEDSMITFDSPNGRVVAVCDGMGGQAAGDVASRLACDIIRDILENNTFNDANEAITSAVMAANQGILHRADMNPQLVGMGATCVIVILRDGNAYYGWVGDSRIYYIANHTIRQLSKDQSYVQQLVDRGELTPEEAEHHPQKNEILNALGVPGMTPPELGMLPNPQPGSVLLLCSDGLSGMVDNEHIERTVSKKELPLSQRAARLVEQANVNGGLDNITVQLIEFVGDQPVAPRSVPSPKAKSQSGLPTWLVIVLVAVIVLGVGLWFVLRDGDKPADAEQPSLIEDNRTKNAPATSPTRNTTTQPPKKTIVVEENKKPAPKAEKPGIEQKLKDNNQAGKGGNKGNPKTKKPDGDNNTKDKRQNNSDDDQVNEEDVQKNS